MTETRAQYHAPPLAVQQSLWELTQQEREELPLRVVSLLRQYRGRERAIRGRDLAAMFGYSDDRQVREAVNIARRRGFPICSSTSKPYGYFWPLTAEETAETDADLKSRMAELGEVHRGFLRGCAVEFNAARKPPLI